MKNKSIRSIRNISWLMTMQGAPDNPVGLSEKSALLIEDGKIAWVGLERDCPAPSGEGVDLDGNGLVAMPGLIDSHTHLVFGGDRIDDFYDRARGVSYADIMARGGGIMNTVLATRSASRKELAERALATLERMRARGVTTVEVKSGYGLNLDDELKLLEVIAELNHLQPITLLPTFMGAHAIPLEFKDRASDYVDFLTKSVLPEVAKRKLATAVDVFVEKGAFSLDEAQKLLSAARALNFKLKVHADQLSVLGGTRLAADLGCVSASHLEHATDADFQALAKAGVVAEIAPLSELYLGMSQLADLRRMIAMGVRIAIATDFNPGSAMCDDLQLAMRIGVTQRKLSVEEALLSVTHYAACAVGEQKRVGQLGKGMQADICLFEGRSPWSIASDWTRNPVSHVVKAGTAASLGAVVGGAVGVAAGAVRAIINR